MTFAVSTTRWEITKEDWLDESGFSSPLEYGNPIGRHDAGSIPLEGGRVYAVMAQRYTDDADGGASDVACAVFRTDENGGLE